MLWLAALYTWRYMHGLNWGSIHHHYRGLIVVTRCLYYRGGTHILSGCSKHRWHIVLLKLFLQQLLLLPLSVYLPLLFVAVDVLLQLLLLLRLLNRLNLDLGSSRLFKVHWGSLPWNLVGVDALVVVLTACVLRTGIMLLNYDLRHVLGEGGSLLVRILSPTVHTTGGVIDS